MNKVLILTGLISLLGISGFCQTVQGTIKKDGNSCIGIYAKPSSNINAAPTNYVFAISIPNQSGGGESNPNTSVTELLIGMVLDASNPSPYTLNGRRYYDFNIVEGSSPPAVSWTGGSEYKIGKVCFSNGTPPPNEEFIQLNDLAGSDYGQNGLTAWYVEFSGLGDVTPTSNLFYPSPTFSTASNGSNSNAETLQGVALPVTLMSFAVSKSGDRSAILHWATTLEINSDYFGIERSSDGVNWETIGQVKASGNSNIGKQYHYLDNALPLNRSESLIYYRLKLTDTDGRFTYSDVRGINFRTLSTGDLVLYPNPAYDLLNVDVSALEEADSGILEIFDAHGKKVYAKTGNMQGIMLLDISNLTAGNYYLNYSANSTVLKKSFIKVQRL